jgi:hypothetical protein
MSPGCAWVSGHFIASPEPSRCVLGKWLPLELDAWGPASPSPSRAIQVDFQFPAPAPTLTVCRVGREQPNPVSFMSLGFACACLLADDAIPINRTVAATGRGTSTSLAATAGGDDTPANRDSLHALAERPNQPSAAPSCDSAVFLRPSLCVPLLGAHQSRDVAFTPRPYSAGFRIHALRTSASRYVRPCTVTGWRGNR